MSERLTDAQSEDLRHEWTVLAIRDGGDIGKLDAFVLRILSALAEKDRQIAELEEFRRSWQESSQTAQRERYEMLKRAEAAERALSEAQQRRDETVAMCEQLQAERDRLREELIDCQETKQLLGERLEELSDLKRHHDATCDCSAARAEREERRAQGRAALGSAAVDEEGGGRGTD